MRLPILMICCSVLFSSCIDIIEEISVNKNGTGNYTLTMDMSALFKDETLMKMFGNESSGGETKMEDMDSLMHLRDIPNEEKGENPAFWDKVKARIQSNKAEKTFLMNIMLDFESLDDIAYLAKNFDKVGKNASPAAGGPEGAGGPDMLPPGLQYSLKGKTLTRKTDTSPQKEENEEMAMMQMFMSNATYRTIYHLPGKIKKTTIGNAKTTGNTVTADASMIELLEGKALLDGSIRFK